MRWIGRDGERDRRRGRDIEIGRERDVTEEECGFYEEAATQLVDGWVRRGRE